MLKPLLTFWTTVFLARGRREREGYPVHHRMCSSIPGLYPLHASSNMYHFPVQTTRNITRHCQMSLGGQNHPQLRTTEIEFYTDITANLECTDYTRHYVILLTMVCAILFMLEHKVSISYTT